MTIADLNSADREAFVAAVGFAFENSPWVAEAAWERRPFANRQALLESLLAVVAEAPHDRKIALIGAHPDLAGRIAREGRLSAASQEEQAAAGLDRLSSAEIARFDSLGAAYRKAFGFPFVICAREHTKDSILVVLAARATHTRDEEFATALDEIAKIARLRLEERIAE